MDEGTGQAGIATNVRLGAEADISTAERASTGL